MTTSEKIIALALANGSHTAFEHFEQLETFYNAVRNEALEDAAVKCMEIKSNWNYCADAIRQMKERTK